MAWNTPGSGGDNSNKNDKDPWTGKPKQPGPPDLEQILRKFYKNFIQSLGKKTGNAAPGGGAPVSAPSGKIAGVGIGLIAAVVIVIWFLWGIFIINPAEQGVVLRFGKFVGTVEPGPHWIPPLIEKVYTVNEQRIMNYSYDSEMLTMDENIVSVALAVQYRIADPKAYLFNVVKPQESLQQATASALRQVIGKTNLTQVLTSGREQVRQQVADQVTKILSRYNTGLLVTDVAMQPAKAPDEVKDAFDDAIKAQEDEQRYENQAQAYAMQVEPIAKGQAQRLLADAKAYQQQAVLHAKADVAPFLALLPQYLSNPQLMRERLYLEMMEGVLTNSNKVLVDTKGDGNMFYLPLDKLMHPSAKLSSIAGSTTASILNEEQPAAAPQAAASSARPDNSTGGY